MKRIGFLIAVLVTAANVVTAQGVVVRSGEHDGYTRLVFDVPPDTGWVLAQRKNGASITIALDDVTFKTNSVFGRLTTNRLTSLSQKSPGSALEMEFGCNCVASAFLYRNSMIVLDIMPGDFLPPLLEDIPPPLSGRTAEATPPYIDTGLNLPLLTMTEQGIKDQLSIRLLQGTDRKILDLELAPVGPRNTVSPDTTAVSSQLNSNVRLTTVLDDLQNILNAELQPIDPRPACISAGGLNFASWSGEAPFLSQVSALRLGLYKEFDKVDDEKALKLAKLYTSYGFGAEALSVLKLVETPPDGTKQISAIARVVDNRATLPMSPFIGLQRCESDAALWAVLSEKELAPDANIEAIEHAFARLPDHLRRLLGPRLSQILVSAQQLEAARRVIRSVDRIEPETTPSVTQAKASVAKAEGNSEREEELLTEVITSTHAAAESPLALARLVEKRWSERKTVSSQELDLAASYAVEFRRSELGPIMNRTYAIALSLSQEFDRAFDVIKALPPGPDSDSAVNRHLHLLSERSDDATFLHQTMEVMQPDMVAVLTTETAIALASRLADLGFAEQTFALANRPEDQSRRLDRARLRARAALLSGRPHQALLELADDNSDEALALRAQAMVSTEDFAAAGDMFRGLEQNEAANRYFWLAGVSDERLEPTGGKYAALKQTTQALSDLPVRSAERPLADAENLLKDSQSARQRIEDMLSAVGIE
ncbi:hypothetical protein D1823_15990 [Ruegeria sp. AD91A]|uniref:hypothetical protein n=1 Tax=Ruegeria sp. AD91A TaxID=2293862 RepID=UPI000E4D5F50|nr:hypothetical protein [Ruegeria sp. AD91A]AXT27931.1 hypothetical protein D1823_15990 [Ruegeria sp. AD91A]